MTVPKAIQFLLVLVLGLPLLQTVLNWAGGLLRGMDDEAAAETLAQLHTGVGVVWLVTLVGLVVMLALDSRHGQPVDELTSAGDEPDRL